MRTKIFISTSLLIITSFIIFSFIDKKDYQKKVALKNCADVMSTGFSNTILKPTPIRKLTYSVRSANNKTTTKGILSKAKTVKEIFEYYPSSWIEEYVLVEITRISNNKEKKELSKNVALTSKQQALLKSAKVGDDMLVRIVYKTKNSVKKGLDTSEIKKRVTIVPDVSARFKGGENDLAVYLRNNSSAETRNWEFTSGQSTKITFTVDEKGETTNIKVTESSGVISVDKSIIQLLEKMPNWLPAKDNRGKHVKQQFKLTIGDAGC
ncbi:conserved protein of unknown function [Tenacibaculum soleae]|uniref:energy transducer TonB n=1 Tax=Tenacibaculum soleae TaxID=447689 RepID=UPI003AB46382